MIYTSIPNISILSDFRFIAARKVTWQPSIALSPRGGPARSVGAVAALPGFLMAAPACSFRRTRALLAQCPTCGRMCSTSTSHS